MHPAEEAAHNFVRFIQGWRPQNRRPEDSVTLVNCLSQWLQLGDGVKSTNGDFTTFLLVVIAICEWLHADPTLLDYRYTISRGRTRSIQRRVGRLLGSGDMTYDLPSLQRMFEITSADRRTRAAD